MERGKYTYSQWIMILMPIYLIAFEYFVFQYLIQALGNHLGYLIGFLIYWILWCTILPIFILGGIKPFKALFQNSSSTFGDKPVVTIILLFWAIPFVIIFFLIPRLNDLTVSVYLYSIMLGIISGITEEILWRGVFTRLFKGNLFLSYIFPSFGFALWYITPLSLIHQVNGSELFSIFIFTFLLGLSWGYYVLKTGSIRWSVISHCLVNIMGYSVILYTILLK